MEVISIVLILVFAIAVLAGGALVSWMLQMPIAVAMSYVFLGAIAMFLGVVVVVAIKDRLSR